MANVQKFCPKGHAYDSSLPACPFCLPGQGGGNVGPTSPANNQYGGNYPGGNVGSTAPVNNQYGGNYPGGNVGPTAPVRQAQAQQATQVAPELLTQLGVKQQQQSTERVRPVVGWLVCVQGPDIGKDFRLHAHFNHVGRAEYQDVCLSDRTVSREHFTVSYDIVNNHYFAEMDKGRTMVYINGYSLGGRALLKKGDQIKVGETLLVFIPLEQKDVKWNWRT